MMKLEEEEITLDKKDRIERIRMEHSHICSSHAFASLYIWKDAMKLSICLTDRMFAVRTRSRGRNTWFFPCGDAKEKKEFLFSHIKEPDFCLCYVREEDADFVNQYFPEQFLFEKKEGDGEYIYRQEEWKELKGKRFAKLRNHTKRAMRDHILECMTLEDSTIPAAAAIIKGWERSHHELGKFGMTDHEASVLLLDHWKELDLCGTLLKVDGEPYAITAGFWLSPTCFDLCIAKQKGTLSGISVYSKWIFISSLSEKAEYINAEEDMEIEGLRMMKQQMKPCGMISMYVGKRNGYWRNDEKNTTG